jgi:hypothetical protein
MGVNKLSVRRPSGVQDGEFIIDTEEYDWQMIFFCLDEYHESFHFNI